MTKIMHTKIVGISFQEHAQLLLESNQIKVGDVLLLYEEPTNPHDGNAIQVCNVGGTVLGYINRNYTKKVKKLMDKGVNVSIANITGGGNKNYGINIKLEDVE